VGHREYFSSPREEGKGKKKITTLLGGVLRDARIRQRKRRGKDANPIPEAEWIEGGGEPRKKSSEDSNRGGRAREPNNSFRGRGTEGPPEKKGPNRKRVRGWLQKKGFVFGGKGGEVIEGEMSCFPGAARGKGKTNLSQTRGTGENGNWNGRLTAKRRVRQVTERQKTSVDGPCRAQKGCEQAIGEGGGESGGQGPSGCPLTGRGVSFLCAFAKLAEKPPGVSQFWGDRQEGRKAVSKKRRKGKKELEDPESKYPTFKIGSSRPHVPRSKSRRFLSARAGRLGKRGEGGQIESKKTKTEGKRWTIRGKPRGSLEGGEKNANTCTHKTGGVQSSHPSSELSRRSKKAVEGRGVLLLTSGSGVSSQRERKIHRKKQDQLSYTWGGRQEKIFERGRRRRKTSYKKGERKAWFTLSENASSRDVEHNSELIVNLSPERPPRTKKTSGEACWGR